MAAVEQRIDELVFRSRVEGVEKAQAALDGLANAHDRAGAAAGSHATVSETTGRRLGNLDKDLDALQKRLAGAPTAWREYERGVDLVSRALDAGKIDAIEYGKTITDLQARLQKVIAPRLGLTVDKTGIAALLDGQQKVSAATRTATTDLLAQAAAAEQAAVAQAKAAARMGQMSAQAATANDNIRLTSNQVTNLGYQLNDVATMASMGMSPFAIISSQAGQVVQALGDGPGGVKGSLQAIGTAAFGAVAGLGPVALGFGAVAAAAAAVAYAVKDSFPDLEKTLKRHDDLIGRITEKYETLKERIEEASKASGTGLNVEAGSLARDLGQLIDRQIEDLEKAFVGLDAWYASLTYGGVGTASIPALPQFDAIREQVEAFRQTLRDGNPDVAGFQQSLAAMYEQARTGGDIEMQKAIEAAFRLTEGLADLERRADGTRTALEGMAQALPPITQDFAQFGTALDFLKRMDPAAFDTLRDGLIDQADALTQAADEASAYSTALAEQQAGIADSVQALRVQVETYGQSAGAVATLRFQTEALAEARRLAADNDNVFDETGVEAQRIRESAVEIGNLTDQLRNLNEERRQSERLKSFDEDITFRMEQVGRTEVEQRVAQQMRSVGLAYGDAANAGREAQLRYLESIEATGNGMVDMGEIGRDVFGSIIDAIGSGENAVESLIGVFANLGKQLASLGAQKLFDGLFGTGQGSPSSSIGDLAGSIGKLAQRPPSPSFSAPAYSSGSTMGQTFAAPVGAVTRSALAPIEVRLPSSATNALSAAAKAIRTIESGSAGGNYGALGPVTRTGDRAYGAYQMMGANLPQWSKAALGREVGKIEFLRSVELQDKIFEHRFGGYMAKYGPEGASRAWFAGEGGMRNYKAQDVVGTSVGGYGSRFGQLYEQHGGANDNSRAPAFNTREMARAVSDGNLDATRRIATGAIPNIGGGDAWSGMRSATGAFSPQMSSQAQQAMAQGWSGFGPMPQQGGLGGLLERQVTQPGSFMGFQHGGMTVGSGLMAGAGGFGAGYSSGSPVSGGLQGALGGFMAGGPIGALIGGAAGVLGGIFGGKAQREKEHQEKAKAWADVQPQWQAYQESLNGAGPRSGLRAYQAQMMAEQMKFQEIGGAAWKRGTGNSSEHFNDVGLKLFNEHLPRGRQRFASSFEPARQDMLAGRGLEGPFIQAQEAIIAAGEKLLMFVDDAKFVFGDTSEQAGQAAEAARAQALATLDIVQPMSQIQTEVATFEGAASSLKGVLVELGMTAEDATAAIDGKLAAAMERLGSDLTQSLTDSINEMDGKGYLATFRSLIDDNAQMMRDITDNGLNVDTSLVDTFFSKSAQSIVDGAQLAGEAFEALIVAFPQLAGVVKAFTGEVDTATEAQAQAAAKLEQAQAAAKLEQALGIRAEAESDLRQAFERTKSELEGTISRVKQFQETVRGLLSDMRLGDSSPLSGKDQFLEAQKAFRDTQALALAGDEDAQGRLVDVSQNYLDEARSYYASSESYFASFYEVEGVLKAADIKAGTQISIAEQELLALNAQVSSLISIDAGIKTVAEGIAALSAAQAAVADAQRGLNGVRDFGAAPTRNQSIIAGLEGAGLNYTGNFGSGGFGQWVSSLPAAQQAQANAIANQYIGIGYAAGGLVTGPGTGTSDSIMARLSNGEFVMPASAVTPRTMPVLEGMRSGRIADNGNTEAMAAELREMKAILRTLTSVTGSGLAENVKATEKGNRSAETAALAAVRKSNQGSRVAA